MAETKTTPNGIKMILIGDSGTGKSSLLLSYTEQRFLPPGEAVATVGVDFRLLKREYQGIPYKVYIWDTAGQERFRTLTSSFYRGASVVLVVFDVGNRESFTNLETWIGEAKRFTAPEKSVHMCIVANKLDIDDSERQVTKQEAEEYATSHGAEYREVSARTMQGVKTLFDEFAERVASTPRESPSVQSIEIAGGNAKGAQDAPAGGSCA
ncbi:small GTP-binding protein domain-containing protein, partial [Catenaria anguillulae PL171]